MITAAAALTGAALIWMVLRRTPPIVQETERAAVLQTVA
jgi:hypothetical protein